MSMFTYRIYTEAINERAVRELTAEYFTAFSMFYGTGVWNSDTEESLIIEIIADGGMPKQRAVTEIARRIKELNNQQAVLVTSQKLEGHKLV